MSSGLILLNKNGAAIAADSAVTLGNRSAIYNTARKIFEVGDAPVLVVITGSISVLGAPIEVILKQFSLYAKKHSLIKEKLSDYGIEFTRFLEEKAKFFMFSDHEKDLYESYIYQVLSQFYDELKNNIPDDSNEEQIKKEVEKTYNKIIDMMLEEDVWKILDSSFQWSDVSKKYPNLLEEVYKDYLTSELERNFEESPFGEFDTFILPFIEKLCSKFTSIYKYFSHNELLLSFSGYGEEQLYPSIYEISVLGFAQGKLLYRIHNNFTISKEYPRNVSFLAQKDVMDSIINGYNQDIADYVDEHYLSTIKKILEDVGKQQKLSDEVTNNIISTLSSKLQDEISWVDATKDYWTKSFRAVQHLPIQDLGKFAENLINIQSLKKQYTPDTDYNSTVGGPTDVAVITKGDGIKWIKNSK